jgi:DNA mismatch endonuclease (patch repair protein)
MRANPRTGTDPEMALRSELHRRGLRFRKDLPLRVRDRVVRPDIVFTRARLAVFVDGCFWHACPEHGTQPKANTDYWRPKLERNVTRDLAVNAALAAAGWRVLRAWEHEPVSDVARRVQALVRE